MFIEVIDRIFLVFIDLVVENEKGEIFFGLRKNCLVKDYWFVFGGWILKNEILDIVFLWLMLNELGCEFDCF